MFLLIPSCYVIFVQRHRPLHSTMFLLILADFQVRFLFLLPLQSTMFLLIRKYSWLSWGGDTVFTFHYVSINTKSTRASFLYSFSFTFHYISINTGKSKADHHGLLHFTFHYVSINTSPPTACPLPALTPLHSTMFLLILLLLMLDLLSVVPLHSTMFLLIPLFEYTINILLCLYIPLCFY